MKDQSHNLDDNKFKLRNKAISNGPSFKKPLKDELPNQYRYVTPVKEYPAKYKEAKIKIFQDVSVHDHYKKYTINVFSNQYNEFIRLVFKNQKSSSNNKAFNIGYVMGLAKTLGMSLKKDAFSE